MKKLHYGWLVCAAGTLLLFITMGTVSNGFSIYLPYIRDSFGFTNAQTSTLITVRCLVSFLAMLGIGFYYKKFSIRAGTGIAAVCAGAAFVLYSFASDYAMFCAATVVAGLAYGLGSMIPVSILINNWFVRHRALALGICACGSGIAAIVLAPLTALAVEYAGIRWAFRTEGICILAAAVLVVLILRDAPEQMGLKKYGAEDAQPAPGTLCDDKAQPEKCVLSRRQWVMLAVACAFMGALANPGFSHLSVLFATAGYPDMTVAAFLSAAGAMLALGKVLCGQAADRIGGKRATLLFCAILFIGQLLCCLASLQSLLIGYAAVLLAGTGYAVSTIGQSVWAAELAPPEQYAAVVRRLQIIYAGGALVFASVPGILADRFGSYFPAYALFAALTAASFVCILLAYRRSGRTAEISG